MVVDENNRRRALQQRCFKAFTRINDRGRQAPDADRMVADSPVFAVERDHAEVLAVEYRKFLAKDFEKLAGVLDTS
jgi:hypothetical protein